MDRDELREEVAKIYSMAKYKEHWDEPPCLSEGRVFAHKFFSLLAPELEKSAKWDALAKKYPHFCERFDVEIDALEKDS